MPLISVIVPTLRVGGLDILFAGLEQQTFQDFELILVDSIHKFRKELVAERAKNYHFPIKHVETIGNPFPLNSYQRCVNTGIVYASGSVCFFTCDYAWLPPNVLSEHADFHRSAQGRASMLGVIRLHDVPLLNQAFPPKYGLRELSKGGTVPADEIDRQWNDANIRHAMTKKWCDDYCADLESGVLDPVMWSIFDHSFVPGDSPTGLPVLHVEMKSSMPEGQVQPQFCHLKNDSIPTESLLAVNGFDERYDGCHGWQDSEVADRMSMRLGMQWHLRPKNILHITDVHNVMIIRKMLRVEQVNESMYLADRQHGYSNPVNPQWSLEATRKTALGL